MPALNLGGHIGYSDWALSDVKQRFKLNDKGPALIKARETLMKYIANVMGMNFTHVYFNGGLHTLHLEPTRLWTGHDAWKNAENMIQDFIFPLKSNFQMLSSFI